MASGRNRILNLLLENIGKEVPRDKIREAAGISEWARRIRELTQEGWQIETLQDGYVLKSEKQLPVSRKRGNINAKQRYRILHRDNSRCRRCGRTPEDGIKLEVDHIIPVDWGGSEEDSNLWALCDECNAGNQAWQSDADAEAMRRILGIKGARIRLAEYFKFKANQICTREELQIVSGISEYARRIRELRERGMNIEVTKSRGDYIYRP